MPHVAFEPNRAKLLNKGRRTIKYMTVQYIKCNCVLQVIVYRRSHTADSKRTVYGREARMSVPLFQGSTGSPVGSEEAN